MEPVLRLQIVFMVEDDGLTPDVLVKLVEGACMGFLLTAAMAGVGVTVGEASLEEEDPSDPDGDPLAWTHIDSGDAGSN